MIHVILHNKIINILQILPGECKLMNRTETKPSNLTYALYFLGQTFRYLIALTKRFISFVMFCIFGGVYTQCHVSS